MLDQVLGDDRYPVDVERLVLEVSRQRFPDDPVLKIEGDNLPGFEGALVPIGRPERRGWGILYSNHGNTAGRRRFTVAHETGHYFLHRHLHPNGIHCDERAITRRSGDGIEKEADTFAANLLMPFHDMRRQLPASEAPSLERLSSLAGRYGVSLTALTLRWLEYTDRRSMMVLSRDGYALWARSSDAALKSGRFIRTSGAPHELPDASLVGLRAFDVGSTTGARHAPGVWFDEETFEYSLRSERFDQAVTVLHFGNVTKLKATSVETDLADTFDFMTSRDRVTASRSWDD